MIDVSGSKAPLPKALIEKIARTVLGARFSLSLVIASEEMMQQLNHEHRNKNEPTDVLAFPLSDDEGESFVCPSMISKKYKDRIYPDYVTNTREAFAFAVIHSLLHLVGYEHGSTMERKERAHLQNLTSILNGQTTNSSRNRHRNDDCKGRRRTTIRSRRAS